MMRLLSLFLINVSLINISRGQSFIEMTSQVGINHQYSEGVNSGGASFFDFNNDGWDDITLASHEGENIHFYKNNFGLFEKIELLKSIDSQDKHILWVDYDNDGDNDLFVASLFAVNRLYNNDGSMGFTDVTASSGLSLKSISTFGASWGDYDRDGYLDLYITNREEGKFEGNANILYKNLGNGKFIDVTKEANVADKDKVPFCSVFFDYNNDGWEDIYIVHDVNPRCVLLKNLGDGTFRDVSKESNSDLAVAGMGIAIGDYDNNGFFDIYVSNTPAGNKLLRNDKNNSFTELADDSGVGYYSVAWGVNFIDYDNNALLDIYVSGALPKVDEENGNVFYENQGDGKFITPSDIGFIGDTTQTYANSIGDFNNDGFPDIMTNTYYPDNSQLWKNTGGEGQWLKVNLEGTISNRDGIGTKLIYSLNGKRYNRYVNCGISFMGQNSNTQILGLKENEVLDTLIIVWPSNHVDTLNNLESQKTHLVIEGKHSSLVPKISQIENCEGKVLLGAGLFGLNVGYKWSTGEVSSTIEIDKEGLYSVEVEFDNKIYEDEMDVVLISNIEIKAEIKDYFSVIDKGEISLAISGGTPPYSFYWSDQNEKENKLSLKHLEVGSYMIHVTDSKGCILQKEFSIRSTITSISPENSSMQQLLIIPNPVEDRFWLKLDKGFIHKVDMFDINGKVIKILSDQNHQAREKEIVTKDIQKGLYIIRVANSKNKIFSKKIIIH